MESGSDVPSQDEVMICINPDVSTILYQTMNEESTENRSLSSFGTANMVETRNISIQINESLGDKVIVKEETIVSEETLDYYLPVTRSTTNNNTKISYKHKPVKKKLPKLLSQHFHIKKTTKSKKSRVKGQSKRKCYSCTVCSFQTYFKCYLSEHIRKHTGEKPFNCSICGKAFASGSNLSSHVRTHSGVRPFSCNICGKSFTAKNSLVRHQPIHTGVRAFSCDICHKAFTQKKTLSDHMLVHSGERPHSCVVCGKTFKRTTHVNRHLRLLHAVE